MLKTSPKRCENKHTAYETVVTVDWGIHYVHLLHIMCVCVCDP